jgi:site-specific DNA-methyltransferase (adenine-specific)
MVIEGGGITLTCGDCLELMRDIPSGSVDMVLADLPYGTTQCKWDSVIPFGPLWEAYKRVCKPNAAIVLTASQPFTSALGASNIGDLRYSWVWEKTTATGHLNAKKMPMKAHEDILVFSQVPHRYFPQELKPLGKVVKRGHNGDNFGKSGTENFQEFTNYPRSLLRYPLDANKLHPTQKPVALMEYLIKTYTNTGEVVLDNTMGSGTTGVACLNTARRFIGIEKDPKYFEIARNRILSDEFSIAIESA